MKINKSTGLALGAVAGALVLSSMGGAVAGSLITGASIKDGTIKSADVKNGNLTGSDIKNGSILLRDLSPGVRAYIIAQAGKDGKDGAAGPKGEAGSAGPKGESGAAGAPGAQGPAGSAGTNGQNGAPGSAAGVQKDWDAKDGATIVDATTVELTNVGTPAGASVEIQNLNLPVQAGKVLSFTYELHDGAVYAAGSPRVFIEVNGDYLNTFDADPSDAGVDNGDGTFTKSWTVTKNGRIGAAGIVVDNGSGSVTISDVTIDGQVLHFQ